MQIIDQFSNFWQLLPDWSRTIFIGAIGALITMIFNGYYSARCTLVDELRSLALAHAICFNVVNRALNFKEQNILEIKKRYDDLTIQYELYQNKRVQLFVPLIDLQSLPVVTFPSASLEKLICEKLSIGVKAVSSVIALSGVINDLLISVQNRNNLCIEFINNWNESLELRLSKYLGLYLNEKVDNRFRDNIAALASQIDDCIFFSQFLSRTIVNFENNLQFKKMFFLCFYRKLNEPDWSVSEQKGLIPEQYLYKAWTSGVVDRPTFIQKMNKFHRKFICQIND